MNSLAVLVGLLHWGLRPDLISFADTGGEKPATYASLDGIEGWLQRVGFPPLVRVVKDSPGTGDRTLEEECLRRETLPSRAFGLSGCAHRWKIEPQEKYLNHWPPALACWARGDKPIKALGYDAGEDHRSRLEEDKKLRYWYPLREWGWDRAECVRMIEAQGLALPPKSACFYCPSSTKPEILRLSREAPDLIWRALEMESLALASTRHDLRSIKGLGRHYSWKELIESNEAERKNLPEAPVESCMICVESMDVNED